jgi:hypothetical protein
MVHNHFGTCHCCPLVNPVPDEGGVQDLVREVHRLLLSLHLGACLVSFGQHAMKLSFSQSLLEGQILPILTLVWGLQGDAKMLVKNLSVLVSSRYFVTRQLLKRLGAIACEA